MAGAPANRCRSCGEPAVLSVLDLGEQPVADHLSDTSAEALAAARHRLAVGCCGECGLVQLDPETPTPPNASHGHGSAFSGTVLEHERQWTEELLALPAMDGARRVLDVGSGTGGLLRPFLRAGHTVQGWERDAGRAEQATAAGVPTATTDGASGHLGDASFDLVLANHTLSHADDLDAAVALLAAALAPGGTLAVEFHSALGILTGGQFDVVCHAHRSYLSLTALGGALARHDMVVVAARRLPLHGGVVRLQARHARTGAVPDPGVAEVLAAEQAAGLRRPEAWAPVAQQAARVRTRLQEALTEHRVAGRAVAGYGAPSRGTTLLNWCGIDAGLLSRTADRSPAKQGRYLPGVATAVCPPEELAARRPDLVVVLVWPLRQEVLVQLDELRQAGTRFLFPLPEPEIVA